MAGTTRVVRDSTKPLVYVEAVLEEQPRTITCPPTPYPDAMRAAGIQGQVVLQVVIDTLGRVEPGGVRVVASPHDSLTSAAMRSLLLCQFRPGRAHGHPVRTLVDIPVTFSLNQR
jgi:protein TonB